MPRNTMEMHMTLEDLIAGFRQVATASVADAVAVHVAVAQSGIAAKLLGDLRRLKSFEEPAADSGGTDKRTGEEGRPRRQPSPAS